MTFPQSYVFDAQGAQCLYQHCPAEMAKGYQRELATIQEEFQQEDREGYAALVKRLRAWSWCHQIPQDHPEHTPLETLAKTGQRLRQEAKVLIVVGIGGSDLGTRTLYDLLCHPYRNHLIAAGQAQGPELYFTGDTFDPLRLQGLLDVLEQRGLLDGTYINIVSKSGTTAETALAAMILADRMGDDWMSRTIATTGFYEKSLLYRWQNQGPKQFFAMFPVPDGVGGRFSFASPVGLVPMAAVCEGDPLTWLQSAMAGYGEAHEAFLNHPVESNPAYQLAETLHVAETLCDKSTLVFYPYFDNANLGAWFVQLYAESVQERGSGLNVIPTTGPTGNHSLLNGIVNGPRDKLVLFLAPKAWGSALSVPQSAPLEGNLEVFRGLSLARAQEASLEGTYQDFVGREVPCSKLTFPGRDTRHVFGLMRLLMDAVAVKGRLQQLHIDAETSARKVGDEDTYIQTGVEGYKKRMRENLA